MNTNNQTFTISFYYYFWVPIIKVGIFSGVTKSFIF